MKDFFDCEFRGKLPVRYKGEMEMYFVNGIIPDLRDENGGPDREFFVKMQMIAPHGKIDTLQANSE